MSLLGVDGCRSGWVVVTWRESAPLECRVVSTAELFEIARLATVVGIDIPIGLLDAGDRDCDREARRFLGRGRASSVFPAPNRAWLHSRTHHEANVIAREVNGKGISIQAFNIIAKVKAIDDMLRDAPAVRDRVREVHPEVSFTIMNGGAVAPSKKTADGRAVRRRLLSRELGAADVARLCAERPAGCAEDDLLDAMAVAWSARRIRNGEAIALPADVVADRYGLRMQIAG